MELALDSSLARERPSPDRNRPNRRRRVDDPVPRRRAAGVTARLIALVMLPVTVMCVLGGSVIVDRRAAAAQAEDIEQGIVGLGELLSLRTALQPSSRSAHSTSDTSSSASPAR